MLTVSLFNKIKITPISQNINCLPDYKYSFAAVVNDYNKTFDP